VSTLWTRLKRFWWQEEIPRWLGMSLVGVCTLSLCLVAASAVVETRREMVAQSEQSMRLAIELVAELLAETDAGDVAAQRRALRSFATFYRCDELRLKDADGVILASIHAREIGKTHVSAAGTAQTTPAGPEIRDVTTATGERRCGIVTPVRRGPSDFWVLEGRVLPPESGVGSGFARSWTPVVILVAVGVFGLVYRRLRRHFRGVTQIAHTLTTHHDMLDQELSSLRLSDELGAVATSWNRLIDLADEFRTEARRSVANAELRTVLERSSGGDLAEALQSMPDGLMVVNDDGHVRFANVKISRWISASAEAGLAGHGLSEIQTSSLGALILQVVERARSATGALSGICEIVHGEAGEGSYRVRVSTPHGPRSQGASVVLVSDITQQLRADKAREEFVSQVTHELRTPLTNIRAYAETLSSGMFDDPKVITECYNVITKETQRLSRLVEDILSLSQLEVGTLQLVPDDVDLHRLLTEAVQDVRGLAEEKSIDLQLSLPPKLPVLHADRDKLAVVLNNLLGNALKYTPSGGHVHVGCQSDAAQVTIVVKDDGIGVDPADQTRIFERFQRGSDPSVMAEAGTGIGLTTAREIVQRHGGDIEVISRKGEGAAFVVRLPCRKAGAGAGATAAPSPSPGVGR